MRKGRGWEENKKGRERERERENEEDGERTEIRQTSREKKGKRDYTRHQQQPL